MIKFEKFLIETGVRSKKYLSENSSGLTLTDNIFHALKYISEDKAKQQIEVMQRFYHFKNKNFTVKKVTISYDIED